MIGFGSPPSVPPVVRETAWRGSQYRFSLEYPASVARVSRRASGGLILANQRQNGRSGAVTIQCFPAGPTPLQAICDQVSGLMASSSLAPLAETDGLRGICVSLC